MAVHLSKGVRLPDVEKQVVLLRGVVVGMVDDGIGRGEDALLVHSAHPGPVPGEIEELARLGQPSKLPSAEVSLERIQGEGPNAPHVYPRPEHGDRDRSIQIRHRFPEIELTNSHCLIVPNMRRFRKCRQEGLTEVCSGVELFCVNLGESVSFVGGKVFEKPAAPAAPAAVKAK